MKGDEVWKWKILMEWNGGEAVVERREKKGLFRRGRENEEV